MSGMSASQLLAGLEAWLMAIEDDVQYGWNWFPRLLNDDEPIALAIGCIDPVVGQRIG